ncbi:MAG: helix-turn-helix domain-containing protein, partial [Actinobacteria bacterium]|nr:helix-turn-helix domain-containing protein [Actinomycetota bacterium]
MIYTVDEVSDLLDIPRPTLYRYLREYSIPHVRRSGKISIPEESFDRIKEARELHREGLGTASVRRRLREGN